jgi:phage protein D
VGDTPLKREVFRDIIQVSYKDSLTQIDSFDITINNWDAKARDFKYSDKPLFNPGKRVELFMGYFGKGSMRKMITGVITSLRPSFPAQGQPTLVIGGQNLAASLLKEKQISWAYPKSTDNDIAKKIEQRLKISIKTIKKGPAEEIKHTYVFQDNMYDLLFLMSRARQIGYELFAVEDEKSGRLSELQFIPSTDVGRTTYELKYGLTLIDFSPELTTHNQVEKVTVHGWDPINKKKISVTVTRKDIKNKGVGSKGGQAEIDKAFTNQEEIISNKPVNSEAEARQLALQTLENIAKEMVKGSGSVVGLPSLRAGCIIFLSGMGDRFSGKYFVTGTTHTIGDSGYTTHFECRREEP